MALTYATSFSHLAIVVTQTDSRQQLLRTQTNALRRFRQRATQMTADIFFQCASHFTRVTGTASFLDRRFPHSPAFLRGRDADVAPLREIG